jgi:predicted lipase
MHRVFCQRLALSLSRTISSLAAQASHGSFRFVYSVYSMLQTHPGFKLYVTGHSMGAALATLFASGAAAEADTVVPKPVSLLTCTGPYVGDQSFREAHQLLESLGKLRHLRVTNHKILSQLFPTFRFDFPFFLGHMSELSSSMLE